MLIFFEYRKHEGLNHLIYIEDDYNDLYTTLKQRKKYIYDKSTMPENAEKYFDGPPGIRTHDLGNTA